MRLIQTSAAVLLCLTLAACGGSGNSPQVDNPPPPPPTNNDGSPVTGTITPRFDPGAGVLPFPINLLLQGTTDLTLNIPVADPTNYGDPQVVLNALDGFSTVAPWRFELSAPPKAETLRAGQTVRVFEVNLTGPGGGVTGIVRELSPQEFVVAQAPSDATGRTVAIVPTVPLNQITSYMTVVTEGITDARGNDATPDQTYFLAKRTSPVCDGDQRLDPLLPATACPSLESLRQLVNSQEMAAASQGIARDDIVLSWVATTQSISVVTGMVATTIEPRSHALVPTGMTLADLNPALPPIADVFIGFIELPYYLDAPQADNPTPVLTGFWQAEPGAYVPPFDALPLDPTSTHLTYANPIPRLKSVQRVPVLATLPNANSQRAQPAAGWPTTLFQHGITGNRSQSLALAGTLASQGIAMVAIDLPLHGLPPGHPLHIGNFPLGATERTFDVDLVDNELGGCAAGPICPDGQADPSGTHFINLGSLLTSRDNIRQAEVDLMSLAATAPLFDFNGDGVGDLDGSRLSLVGMSLGGIVGAPFVAMSDRVDVAALSVPGGGVARLLDGSESFGPRIRAGLAASGVVAGTPLYDTFMAVAQTAIDASDPINYGFIAANNAVLLHQVAGDAVVPNTVAGAPLAGTEALIRVYGLDVIDQTVQDPAGVRAAVRFSQGGHGSLLDPGIVPEVTQEMQRQIASFIASHGTAVLVSDTSVIE